MRQRSLFEEGIETLRKSSRREKFLGEMNEVTSPPELYEVIKPFYQRATAPSGRQSTWSGHRIHFLEHWFNLSAPTGAEALYDLRVMWRFVDIDPGWESLPDETTIRKFRHIIERHNPGAALFRPINE